MYIGCSIDDRGNINDRNKYQINGKHGEILIGWRHIADESRRRPLARNALRGRRVNEIHGSRHCHMNCYRRASEDKSLVRYVGCREVERESLAQIRLFSRRGGGEGEKESSARDQNQHPLSNFGRANSELARVVIIFFIPFLTHTHTPSHPRVHTPSLPSFFQASRERHKFLCSATGMWNLLD